MVHESPQYIVVEESPPPADRNPVGPMSPPLSPRQGAYIRHVKGILYRTRPSRRGGSEWGHSSSGGGACTGCSAPDTLSSPCRGALGSLRGGGGCRRGLLWVFSSFLKGKSLVSTF